MPRTPRRARYPLGIALRTALSRRRRLIAAVLLSAAAAIAVLQVSPGPQETVPTVVAARSLGAGAVLSADDLRVVDYPLALAPAGAAPPSGGAAAEAGSAVPEAAPAARPSSAAGAAADSPVAQRRPSDDPAAAWVGRTLAAAVVEGQPLTGPSVLGPDLLSGQPPGSTAVTLRVADPGTLAHVRPGQHVDLIRADGRASDGAGHDADASDPPADPEDGGTGDAADPGAARVAAGLPVLWVADPAAPSDGLLESSQEVQDDLLVVGADAATAERIASTPEGELVPVLVAAPAESGRPGPP
ncbi:SAF domain-containing protein [Kocuria palustris]|uniref:SAF domain-containing protein n=1 Tax=Kocuria palustris TaxID=71999 RepID=UPI00119D638E|nr:SAF domain-containing protein [Kocuria palustris]